MEYTFKTQKVESDSNHSSQYNWNDNAETTEHTVEFPHTFTAHLLSYEIDLPWDQVSEILAKAVGEESIQIHDAWDSLSCLFSGESGEMYMCLSDVTSAEMELPEGETLSLEDDLVVLTSVNPFYSMSWCCIDGQMMVRRDKNEWCKSSNQACMNLGIVEKLGLVHDLGLEVKLLSAEEIDSSF